MTGSGRISLRKLIMKKTRLHCIALYAGMPPGKIKDSGAMHEATGKTKYISCCGIHVCAGEKTTGRFYSRGFALKY